MKPSVQAILEEAGCEIPTEPAPKVALDSPMPFDQTTDFSHFNTKKLYTAAGEPGEGKSRDEKYLHMRQFYLNQVRADSRQKLIQAHEEKIRKILTEGTPQQYQELLKQRHIWRTRAHEIRNDDKPICKFENCIQIALPGSDYCVAHILNDPDQKLFVACPKCNRPHPVCTDCFTCRE